MIRGGGTALRTYYHCNITGYKKRERAIIVLSASFFSEIAVVCFFVLFFNLFGAPDRTLIIRMLAAAAGSILIGLVICFAASEICRIKTRRASRYTYLDFQLKAAVFSRYSAAYRVCGEKLIFRELYLIPFKDFLGAEACSDGKRLIVRGKIRRYFADSDSLGYHVREGEIEFDRWWLNHGSYEELSELIIPNYFGNPARLAAAFRKAKDNFDHIPPPKEYKFKEADFIRRRPKPRTLPDSLDFRRDWS